MEKEREIYTTAIEGLKDFYKMGNRFIADIEFVDMETPEHNGLGSIWKMTFSFTCHKKNSPVPELSKDKFTDVIFSKPKRRTKTVLVNELNKKVVSIFTPPHPED